MAAGDGAGVPAEAPEVVGWTQILTRRAEIARAIEGQTICGLLELAAREFADRPALSEPARPATAGPATAGTGTAGTATAGPGTARDDDHHDHAERARPGAAPPQDGGWHTLTWPQARERVLWLAASFEALGLAPGERVALMLPNRTEHWLADQAAVHAAGVPVTLYSTLAPEQIAYTAQDCDARIAVLDGARELALWRPVLATLPGLKKIIVRDPAACPPTRTCSPPSARPSRPPTRGSRGCSRSSAGGCCRRSGSAPPASSPPP